MAEAIDKAGVTGHSWYPVCRGSLDDVVGVVSVSKLLALRGQALSAGLAAATPAFNDRSARHVLSCPRRSAGMELLEQFRHKSPRAWCSWWTSTAWCRA
jgi:putative hemolysin